MNQPTVLPWHKAAATDIHETPLPTMSQYVNIIECMEARIDRLAAIIASHDPHATTLRLLEEAVAELDGCNDNMNTEALIHEIRAHLATLSKPSAHSKPDETKGSK